MNNSLSSGSSVLGTLLAAKKLQPFVANSAAPNVAKRESTVIGTATGGASTRNVTQPVAERQSANFRATMSEVASAKAQARREDSERMADKKFEQQAAARKSREQSHERHRSVAAQNEASGQASAKPSSHPLDCPKEKPDVADTRSAGEDASSPAVGEAAHQEEFAAGNTFDVPLTDAVDQLSGAEEMNIDDLLDVVEDPLALFSASNPGSTAEIAVQGSIPLSPLNPEGVSLSFSTAEQGPAVAEAGITDGGDEVQTSLQAIAVPSAAIPALAAQASKGGDDINQTLRAKGDAKSGAPVSELAADALVGEDAGETRLLKDSVIDENKTSFGRLLAVAQGNREGQLVNQELAAVKTSVAAPQILESTTRPAESPAPAMRGFVVQSGVPLTMGQPRWGEAVGERVLWLAAQNLSSAELRLDPPELGPMQVRITIQHDQATVSFSSPHPGVREALDQSAVRLREMFNEQGLNLLNVDVSDQPLARHQTGEQGSGHRAGQGAGTESTEEEIIIGTDAKLNAMRLIDHYA